MNTAQCTHALVIVPFREKMGAENLYRVVHYRMPQKFVLSYMGGHDISFFGFRASGASTV